jgi:hypothetical protein
LLQIETLDMLGVPSLRDTNETRRDLADVSAADETRTAQFS